ncbi:hypothetical protein L914_05099 [Phytophthora nicotianae]|uniref:Uncharacterized protein n=4 Tax=Phytophthora nicotianae TaxID=4792 RepID=V9FKH7_PHYNI|nr:hypothetical protein F443_05284 [Phytophthora nicotianae P1569]ETM50931.1 hypothetical protein L914_05099 [Phytophthora nicotianae]
MSSSEKRGCKRARLGSSDHVSVESSSEDSDASMKSQANVSDSMSERTMELFAQLAADIVAQRVDIAASEKLEARQLKKHKKLKAAIRENQHNTNEQLLEVKVALQEVKGSMSNQRIEFDHQLHQILQQLHQVLQLLYQCQLTGSRSSWSSFLLRSE